MLILCLKKKDKDKDKDMTNKVQSVKLDIIKGTPGYMAPEIIRKKRYSVKAILAIGARISINNNSKCVEQSASMGVDEMIPDRKIAAAFETRE